MANNLYIIDGHAHIYAAYYAPMRQRLSSPVGEPTKATYIFTMALLGIIKKKAPDMLVVVMDSKEPTFRVEIYKEYKANRPPMPDDMPVQINRIEQILEAMRIPMLRVSGYEADDIIGTLSKWATTKGIDTFICSNDKDVLQLINEHVNRYDIKKDVVTDLAAMKNELGVTPEQFLDCLALQGDTSDNVPGVPDVGPKTALGWIQKYGSIENLYEHIDEIGGKRGDNLRKYKDQLMLSKELVTIDCDVPVEIDWEKLKSAEFDKDELGRIFNELGFSRLISQLGLTQEKDDQAQQQFFSEGAADLGEPATVDDIEHDYVLVDSKEKFEDFIAGLAEQKLFAIDTETTSVYPMRAELVGISISWAEYKAFYLPVRAPLGAKFLDINIVREKLGSILADDKIQKVGQNIKYDMLVLRNAGLPLAGVSFDTMVASYCLDPARSHSMDNMALDFLNYKCIPISELIGKGKKQITFDMVDTAAACEYSAEDADVTLRLYKILKSRLESMAEVEKLFKEVELPLISVLAQMEYNGVSLDIKLLRKMSGEVTEEIKQLTDNIYETAGTTFNIDSPKQLAEVLFDRLGLQSRRVGKAGRSTDAAVLEQLSGEHPIVDLVLQYRTLSKLKSTYIDKLGAIINQRTGRVHGSFNQTITATGRLSSSDPNLQNIPIRTEIGRKIRSAFVPGNIGDCILSADYSQIELRFLAHFSKDKALLEAFANDMDIHAFVASQIYNVPIEDVTSDMRSRCKAVNFGIIYGQGAFGLSRTTGLGVGEAKKFIADYFTRYSSIRDFMDGCVKEVAQAGFAKTILGRRRNISDLKSPNAGKRAQAQRLAVNTVIQGSAADLIKVAMLNIQRKIDTEDLPVKMILQVHDELVFELPLNEAEKHSQWISKEMSGAIKLDVPLKVDIHYGPSWLAE